MKKIIIVGGGAAGLLAGIAATQNKANVIILEKMSNVGKKLLISGKGRCNLTNDTEISNIIKNMTGNGNFLFSALHQFDNYQIRYLLENEGLKTKVERGNRVFPITDKAKDVLNVLLKIYAKQGGKILTNKTVNEILISEKNEVIGVKTGDGEKLVADRVIFAVGGASYPGTGSDGKSYKLLERIGHTITPILPALVPIISDSEYIQSLQGLSLKNVSAKIFSNEKIVAEDFGEMLFTHYGFSGPIILSMSKIIAKNLKLTNNKIELAIDLKPALSIEKLDARIQRVFDKYKNKNLINGAKDLLPTRLLEVVLKAACLDPKKQINQISKIERTSLVTTLKALKFNITGTRSINEAIVTAGGVSTKEINPKTMESKLIANLYFAGEIIDVDGYTGGFNLQSAFSTGYVAGASSSEF